MKNNKNTFIVVISSFVILFIGLTFFPFIVFAKTTDLVINWEKFSYAYYQQPLVIANYSIGDLGSKFEIHGMNFYPDSKVYTYINNHEASYSGRTDDLGRFLIIVDTDLLTEEDYGFYELVFIYRDKFAHLNIEITPGAPVRTTEYIRWSYSIPSGISIPRKNLFLPIIIN